MYKRNSFILFLLLGVFVFKTNAQTIQDNFEGSGNITTWFGDNCGLNTNFNNPYKDSLNNSNKVLEYKDNGGQYANVRFDATKNLNLMNSSTFTLLIYVPSSSITGSSNNQISLKLQDGNLPEPWSTQCEIIKPLVLDSWQVVSFNFAKDTYINLNPNSLPPTKRQDFNRVLLQVNGENNTNKVIAYLDDFYFYSNDSINPSKYNTLVWFDEFNNNGDLDSSKWFRQTKLPNGDSWYNGEIQHYTSQLSNSFVEDGNLKIVAKKENFTDQGKTKLYTSARLNSKFAFTYGRVEVKAKLPTGVGTWPAVWMLGKNINEPGAYWENKGFGTENWPACGEIDIMEHWGDNQNFVQSAMHTPSSFGNTVNKGGRVISTASTAFHVYSLEWGPDKMDFAVDGIIHYTYKPSVFNNSTWPFNAAQYLILNIAIQPNIAANFTQGAMDIDYVRIYQEKTTAIATLNNNEQINFFPNPVNNELNIDLSGDFKENTTLKISNILGETVYANEVFINGNNLQLNNLSHLKQGVYFTTFTLNQKNYQFKFIKN
jgi:beta-glucanase (GH16 family)